MGITSGVGVIEKRVLYAQAVFGREEVNAVVKSLENGWLASGPLVKKFEQSVASLFGKKYGIAVNSGSSANLLVISALGAQKGSEIITPACTFSTTVSNIVNCGYKPVFVDSVVGRYTINEDLVEAAINSKTCAIMVPQLIGGICDMPRLYEIAKKHNLVLIDDSCDTLAPTIKGHQVSRYAHVSTTSFYGSHIITACGMGGMIMTNNKEYRDKMVSLRDWGRVGNDAEAFENRFDFEIDGIPYDAKFLYTGFGYNLKMNEVAAAFGLEQLKRLTRFTQKRKKNFEKLYNFFSNYEEHFHLPELIKGATTNWLAFPLTIRKEAPFKRYDLLKHFEKDGIQTRVLFSGNITRHPVYKDNPLTWRQVGELSKSDFIMANGFLIGAHQGMGDREIEIIADSAMRFFNQYE